MEPSGALDLITGVLDPGTWRCWDGPAGEPPGADPDYLATWHAARERTGLDESVVTGEGRIVGRRVALMACHFEFMAGSVGSVAAERLTRAAERATAERLPLLAVTRSGGTRMQEGTLAFVRMAAISAAVARHRAAGLPYLVYLRDPTTGGVLATWGSLGHLTVAEPGALVGFLGPRVYEAVRGEPFPAGVQVAENLVEHGIVDDVVSPAGIPSRLSRALGVLCARQDPLPAVPPVPDVPLRADVPAWESVERSRRPDRPGVCDLLAESATDVSTLSGTAAGERAHTMVLALARFGGAPCVVLGHDRRAEAAGHQLGPAGLRVARRGLRLAAELDLPLLTVVDTAGAALTPDAEEGGLAGEIARCLAEELVGLLTRDPAERSAVRLNRYRRLGR
jgi:acyl-CoA carboxylase subunit beta